MRLYVCPVCGLVFIGRDRKRPGRKKACWYCRKHRKENEEMCILEEYRKLFGKESLESNQSEQMI